MDTVPVRKLKKGLGKIKNNLNNRIGSVWKLNKEQVINKIKELKYEYDEKSDTLKSSKKSAMIRKPTTIKL